MLGVTAVFGSFGPVIAVSALPANLNQTFASGEQILRLLEEQPEVEAVENGTELAYEGLEVNDLSFAYGGEAGSSARSSRFLSASVCFFVASPQSFVSVFA